MAPKFSIPEDFKVPKLTLDKSLLKNKSIVIYGLSDTGKTTITLDIMHILRDDIEQVIVVNKNEESNNSYNGVVPQVFVHKNLTPELIDEIWSRQGALTGVYKQANRYDIILSIYKHVRNEKFDEIIDSVNSIRDKEIKDIKINNVNDVDTKIAELNERMDAILITVMKKRINAAIEIIRNIKTWNQEQKYTLEYLNLNPNVLFIIDDCIEDVKKLHKHEYWNQMFTAGRHRNITFVVLLQDDTPLSPEQRKNTAVNIFTSQQIANTYFDRAINGFSKEQKLLSIEACKRSFTESEKHQKLLYHRKSSKFFRVTATLRPKFKMCPQYMWDYSDMILKNNKTLDTSNRHYKYFQI